MSATYPVGMTRIHGETLALSTTIASLGIPPDFHQAIVYNSADFRLGVCPALRDVNFYDASATEGSRFIKDGSTSSLINDMTDRSSTTGTGTVMDSSTTSDYLYLMFNDVIGGLRVVMKSANASSANLTAAYRQNDNSWHSLSITDGSASGGATLAQTGSITWTAPTDWKAISLNSAATNANGVPSASSPPGNDPSGAMGFWLRLSWSGALDSDTEIQDIWSLSRDANRGYFRANQEYHLSLDRSRVGSIEALLASSTSTAQITWVRTVH